MHTLRERSRKVDQRKDNGTVTSFGDRRLKGCAWAATSWGSHGKWEYVVEFSTTGATEWKRATLDREVLAN